MRNLSLAILVLSLASCMSSTQRSRTDEEVRKGAPSRAQALATMDSLRLTNKEILLQMNTRPDSMTFDIHTLDGVQGTLYISGSSDAGFYGVKKIRVAFPDGRRQELPVDSSMILTWTGGGERYPYIRFEDLNFDGSTDLLLFDNSGATGNVWYQVWLYNQQAKLFSYNKELSGLSGLQADLASKEIISYNHLGGVTSAYSSCDAYLNYYTLSNNKLVEKRQYQTHAKSSDAPCYTFLRERVDTGWKETNLGEWDTDLYDSLYLKFDRPGMLHRLKYPEQ
jgi:hypothetical protein